MDDSKKVTVPGVVRMKAEGRKITALTAYDTLLGSILDSAGIDIILVGDSGAMVFAGYENTLPITVEHMLYHTQAVRRGVKRALLVVDMPFLSYQVGIEDAVRNAGRFLKEAGAEAVKIEGGEPVIDTVRRLVEAGIPVMGHLGLTPQSIHVFGGYGVQATEAERAQRLLDDARKLEAAGAFSIVLEKIPASLAREVTQSLSIPTIGIGAGVGCDGQILVTHDMLGLFEKFHPKFVRRYAELGAEIRKACEQYIADVRQARFPGPEESF